MELTFEIPYKNASRDLVVRSDISFLSFLTRVAGKMETSVTHLSQIGYILPWKAPKTGKPVAKLLEDDEAFGILIGNVWAHVDEQKAKNRGKGIVKPFTISIADTSGPQDAAGSKVFDLNSCNSQFLIENCVGKHQEKSVGSSSATSNTSRARIRSHPAH
jgi:hypothetical protein